MGAAAGRRIEIAEHYQWTLNLGEQLEKLVDFAVPRAVAPLANPEWQRRARRG